MGGYSGIVITTRTKITQRIRRWTYLLTALGVLVISSARAAGQSSGRRLDLVLITIDTLRADHLGCYGYRKIETPNLDALAAAGSRFSHAYSPVPITLPAHTAIMTGRYPMGTGMHDFSGNKLPPDTATLATILKAQGYETAAFVSAAVLDSRFGLNAGFDDYYDHFDFSRLDESNLDLIERPGDQTVDRALMWLHEHQGPNAQKPFFLWVHLYDPHYPYTPPDPYATRYRDRRYDGEIAFADTQAGRLLTYLKDRKLFDSSVVVMAGDHGEGLGEHGEKNHGFFIYNSTLHVPLIVRVPGITPGLVQSDASLIDVMPTVLDALKIAIPAGVQGRSLIGDMRGRHSSPGEPPRELYAETYLPLLHFRWSNLRAIQVQGLKYIDAPRPELYDLRADPGELKDLSCQRPAVARELHAKLLNLVNRDTPAAGREPEAVLTDPILLARLRSLGYLATGGGAFTDPQGKALPDPKDRVQVYELFSEAMSDGQHGRYQESLQKLAEADKADPQSLPIHYLMALDYYRLKEFSSAEAQFKSAIELDPRFALATYYLGLAQVQLGDRDAAAASLQRALQLDPTNFSAAFDLGALFLKMNRVDDAVSEFRRATEINPEFANAFEALGEVYLYQKRPQDAAQMLERAVQLQPDFAKAHYNLGRAYQALGQSEDAQRQFDLGKPP